MVLVGIGMPLGGVHIVGVHVQGVTSLFALVMVGLAVCEWVVRMGQGRNGSHWGWDRLMS